MATTGTSPVQPKGSTGRVPRKRHRDHSGVGEIRNTACDTCDVSDQTTDEAEGKQAPTQARVEDWMTGAASASDPTLSATLFTGHSERDHRRT